MIFDIIFYNLTENFVENLVGEFEVEVQVSNLLYRNASQQVIGFWFDTKRECQGVASLFTRILGSYSKVPQKKKNVNKSEEIDELEGRLERGLTISRSTDVPRSTATII
ncbi:putative mRNA-decapping enzyme subunit 1, PH-like domain superfamily [Helianthus debilis subsp. tardiflorus]